jgi:hypothetical protein
MSQRIYQTMKFFAILVFSFEMVAPAFVQGSAFKKETAARIINASSSTQNQLYCLIAEEFGINEEDGLDSKEFVPFFDFDLVSIFDIKSIESASSSVASIHHAPNVASQRPLFLLHQLFLI